MSWTYPLKHWITTLLVGLLIADLLMDNAFVIGSTISGFISSYFFYLAFSLLFSLPTLIIYAVVFFFLKKNRIEIKKSKFVLISTSMIGILATFFIIYGKREDVRVFEIGYPIASVISGVFLKLESPTKNI